MRDAEEFSGGPSDQTRVLPVPRWLRRAPGTGAMPAAPQPAPRWPAPPSPGSGRIRYAHGARLPRVQPLCTVSQGLGGYPVSVRELVGDTGNAGDLGLPWAAEYPVAGRRHDLWVLVSGGIAAAAAFAAAFVASGGLASHPAAPNAVPAAVSQSCPAPVPGP